MVYKYLYAGEKVKKEILMPKNLHCEERYLNSKMPL